MRNKTLISISYEYSDKLNMLSILIIVEGIKMMLDDGTYTKKKIVLNSKRTNIKLLREFIFEDVK